MLLLTVEVSGNPLKVIRKTLVKPLKCLKLGMWLLLKVSRNPLLSTIYTYKTVTVDRGEKCSYGGLSHLGEVIYQTSQRMSACKHLNLTLQ